MLRSARRFTTVSVFFSVVVAASVFAQVQPAQNQNAAAAQQNQPQISDALWTLLGEWEQGSARVKKLHGKHVRRAYDLTFGREKIAHGEFWYENPDKGRMDIKPVKITQQMLAERKKPDAKVERKKNGEPYDLTSGDPERWICDGEKMWDINDLRKEANVMVLPPEIRGTEIMNSPLPFLFGLPRDQAIRRFNMTIVRDYRPTYPVVRLHIKPRLAKDARVWSEAEVLLDTDSFLPRAVKLINPARTKDTRYTFSDMEINKNGGIWQGILGSTPWDPKLSNDYKINVLKDENVAEALPGSITVPNVTGKLHDVATSMLLEAGVPREQISLQKDVAAPNARLTYTVNRQHPQAGKPLPKGQKVVLMVFDKHSGRVSSRPPQ